MVNESVAEAGKIVKQGDDILSKIRDGVGGVLSDPKFWVAMAAPAVVILLAIVVVWGLRNPDVVKSILADPNILRDVFLSGVTVAILLSVYVIFLKPEIRIGVRTKIDQKCPDRWALDPHTGYCEPKYKTSCQRFRPTDPSMQSFRGQCDFALACGTNWAGLCE